MIHSLRRYLLLLMLLPMVVGMKKSSGPSLAWLVEGEELEGPKMVRRDIEPAPDGKFHYFRFTPMVTQNDIRGMIPMLADDGTWGGTFLVNENGWRSIQATAALDSGKLLRVMVNGRPVEFQRVSKPAKEDYLIVIWRGITESEMEQLKRRYKDFTPKRAARAE
jgi:hypothetical protein